jgi:hypothetical protein
LARRQPNTPRHHMSQRDICLSQHDPVGWRVTSTSPLSNGISGAGSSGTSREEVSGVQIVVRTRASATIGSPVTSTVGHGTVTRKGIRLPPLRFRVAQISTERGIHEAGESRISNDTKMSLIRWARGVLSWGMVALQQGGAPTATG